MSKAKGFRTRFTERLSPQLMCTEEERRTKSEFKDECDINAIMKRYHKTGIMPVSAKQAAGRFGDFSQIPDFAEMQARIFAAEEMFAALPADVRKEFHNDPGQFIAASQTKEGRALLVELGLGKEAITASQPASASPAGQAEGAGTEPAPAPAKGAKQKRESGSADE